MEGAAEPFQFDAKRVRNWVGGAGRKASVGSKTAKVASAPTLGHLSRQARPAARQLRRELADHIAHGVGLARSTAQSIVKAATMGRLDRGDRAIAAPVQFGTIGATPG